MKALNCPRMLKVAIKIRNQRKLASDVMIWAEKNPNGCFRNLGYTNSLTHFDIDEQMSWSQCASNYTVATNQPQIRYDVPLALSDAHRLSRRVYDKLDVYSRKLLRDNV